MVHNKDIICFLEAFKLAAADKFNEILDYFHPNPEEIIRFITFSIPTKGDEWAHEFGLEWKGIEHFIKEFFNFLIKKKVEENLTAIAMINVITDNSTVNNSTVNNSTVNNSTVIKHPIHGDDDDNGCCDDPRCCSEKCKYNFCIKCTKLDNISLLTDANSDDEDDSDVPSDWELIDLIKN